MALLKIVYIKAYLKRDRALKLQSDHSSLKPFVILLNPTAKVTVI